MQPGQISSLYTSYRNYLFAIAYNMLGEVHEAADLVQDVFESLLQGAERQITQPKAYLSRTVVNRCIDRLERKKRERQSYPGPWLPEPIMTESDDEPTPDVLSYAVLCLLEQLNPLERAVLILREAFDHDYAEIAALCDIRTDHCRQVLHRAKEKVRRPLKSPHPNEAQRDGLLQAFIEASFSGDAARLAALLREDIVLYADGGGKASAALKPLSGAPVVAKFITALASLPGAANWEPSLVTINGETAACIKEGNNIIAVFMPSTDPEGRVSTLYAMRNPDKIFFSTVVTN